MKWRALLVELPPVCVETKWMDGPRRRHVAVSTIIVIVLALGRHDRRRLREHVRNQDSCAGFLDFE